MNRKLTIVELPFLNGSKKRKIRILHPLDLQKSYPVLLMHDGQNLFENETSYTRVSWGIKETIEQLVQENKIEDLIVVGIDNSENRVDEYSPWKATFYEHDAQIEIGGKGASYMSFVIDTVVPYIEQNYNIEQKKPMMIAGSSLGALISSFIAISHPNKFLVCGVFSLASWICESSFLDFVKNSNIPSEQRFFISVGTNETSNEDIENFNEIYIQNSVNLKKLLKEKGVSDILHIECNDIHHESAWRKRFVDFILWALPKV
jgi:uncharacterized protein